MKLRQLLTVLVTMGAVSVLSACTPPAPYIYNADEFDRGSPDFAKKPTKIETVTICYNKRSARPQQISAMARAECAKFGKSVRFNHQDILTCPLFTPTGAHYDCVEAGR